MTGKTGAHQSKITFFVFSSSIVCVLFLLVLSALGSPISNHPSSNTSADEGIPSLASQEQTNITSPIYQVNIPQKVVALTFDDGPHPLYTPKVLQLLRENHIHATFFIIGSQAEKFPDIVHNLLAEGHEVASHGYHHHNVTELSEKAIYQDISHSVRTIENITNHPIYYYRPVGGAWNHQVMQTSLQLGLEMILWSVDPRDWDQEQSVTALEQSLNRHTHGGDIILLHDGGHNQPAMLKALEQVIDQFQPRGFRFVTMSELMTLSE